MSTPGRRPIRCITFDWGDTLAANVGMPYLATQRRAFGRLGADLAALGCAVPGDWLETSMRELEESWSSSIDVVRNPEHREFDFRGMLDGWVAAAGAMDGDPHAVRQAIDRCLRTLVDTVPAFGESVPALSLLKARGYRLGILSHVTWPGDACRGWFARHGLAPYLDFYSLSCEVGWIKPNPRHFRHALDQTRCEPDEVLHVGDHPLRDIQGAKAMGMRTCLRLTEGIYQAEAMEACKPDAQILHLGELLEVLEVLETLGR